MAGRNRAEDPSTTNEISKLEGKAPKKGSDFVQMNVCKGRKIADENNLPIRAVSGIFYGQREIQDPGASHPRQQGRSEKGEPRKLRIVRAGNGQALGKLIRAGE